MAKILKPGAVISRLRLRMPVELQLEDPITRAPIVVDYQNLHEMLAVNFDSLQVESQLVANLYVEMGRLAAAARFEKARAEGRYRSWKAKVQQELRDARKAEGGKKAPTVKELEDAYRSHPDYDRGSMEAARYQAIAETLDEARWGFRMKSEHILASRKEHAIYEATSRGEDSVTGDGYETYEQLAAEANALVKKFQQQQQQGRKAPKPLEETEE